jgi:hypothetical protein
MPCRSAPAEGSLSARARARQPRCGGHYRKSARRNRVVLGRLPSGACHPLQEHGEALRHPGRRRKAFNRAGQPPRGLLRICNKRALRPASTSSGSRRLGRADATTPSRNPTCATLTRTPLQNANVNGSSFLIVISEWKSPGTDSIGWFGDLYIHLRRTSRQMPKSRASGALTQKLILLTRTVTSSRSGDQVSKGGYHLWKTSYDARGNPLESAFFDTELALGFLN